VFYTEQVERLLKAQELTDQNKYTPHQESTSASAPNATQQALPSAGDHLGTTDKATMNFSGSISPGTDAFLTNGPVNVNAGEDDFRWEVIGLGLDEPLPPQDVINDL